MGMNSIEKGSKDYWTITPKRIDGSAAAGIRPRRPGQRRAGDLAPAAVVAGLAAGARGPPTSTTASCTTPNCAIRAATFFPSDQPDFANATEFINALLKTGITC